MSEGSAEFPTILGPDAVFKGELSFEKGMRLHGRLEGKVTTPGRIHIAKEAKMQADVDAGAITVEGEVKGNLHASDRIELKNTARYEGDLRATKLVVDEGAIFSGHVSVGPDAMKAKPAVQQPPTARTVMPHGSPVLRDVQHIGGANRPAVAREAAPENGNREAAAAAK